jgi:hypothetical protein
MAEEVDGVALEAEPYVGVDAGGDAAAGRLSAATTRDSPGPLAEAATMGQLESVCFSARARERRSARWSRMMSSNPSGSLPPLMPSWRRSAKV